MDAQQKIQKLVGNLTTKVGKYTVPIQNGKWATVVTFKDLGECAFWTCVLKDPVKDGRRVRKVIIARAKIGLTAGDRFDRMRYERKASYIPKADQSVYEKMWIDWMKKGENVACVHPSTKKELASWFASHTYDYQRATNILIGGKHGATRFLVAL